ncbi:uncharacterized protein LOC118427277 [Branchiostoma floridae]|uniref:Uncharacterized protein LOC118427277 n=1 Tax=Branchiostoma floridae TaxID=7739 RepID=A0A9J7M297_BRAFL|nr:uncharacterized protein LOC118427277 [Branchiostoma floridae]
MVDNADQAGIPGQGALIRRVNRLKSKLRPSEPKDLDFELARSHLPEEFLLRDVKVYAATTMKGRHILFATDHQLKLLASARRWYMDGTFKVVHAPFKQLFSVHAFVRCGDNIKQVPLAFALMTSRCRTDYMAVLTELKKALPREIELEEGVTDFEVGLCQAFQEVFQGTRMKGCAFHWCQAIWRKVQELGLQRAYNNDHRVYSWVRRLMALPFLPHKAIQPALRALQSRAAGALTDLADYVQKTWVDSTVFPPRRWSVYMQAIRTNNDVEGWHRRLNLKARKTNLPFYLLVDLLFQESQVVKAQVRMIYEGSLRQHRRSQYRSLQQRLFKAWQEFDVDKRTARELLAVCSRLYGPTITHAAKSG